MKARKRLHSETSPTHSALGGSGEDSDGAASGFVKRYEKAIERPLDDSQRRAIIHGRGPLYIMAGPGSGKTEVVVARTLKLVLVDGLDPRSIFLTTFTDKAARNLEDRIADRLSRLGESRTLDGLVVGTLHSLCDRVMREFRFQNYHDSRLLDDVEQSFFIHKELHDWLRDSNPSFWEDLRFMHPQAHRAFGPTAWQKVETFKALSNRVTEEQVPSAALRASADPTLATLAEGIDLYRRRLSERDRSDFAHVQQTFLEFLVSHAGEAFLKGDPPRLIPPLSQILVDEYQDTNPIQESIYLALAAATGGNITVVGDDDQSLYRFRGGTVECLVRFPDKCQTTLGRAPLSIQLRTNYRSVEDISRWCEQTVAAQPEMAAPGARAPGKQAMLVARGPAEHPPSLLSISGRTLPEVGTNVAGVIAELLQKNKVADPSEIAILLRSTRESPRNAGPLVAELRRHKIPVYNPRSKSFTESEEVSAMLGGLIRVVDPELEVASTLRGRSEQAAVEAWCGSWEAVAGAGTPLRTYYLKVRRALDSAPMGAYRKDGLLDAFYRILSVSPFSAWQEDPERTYRLGLLSAILESYVAVEGQRSFKTSSKDPGRFSEGWLRGSFYPRLIGYLANAKLDDPGDPDYEIVPGRVQVMTVHQAKGLEFPVVFVGSLNHQNEADDKTYRLEDRLASLSTNRRALAPPAERSVQDTVRFFYVAFSRAQDLLCLFGTESHFEGATISLGRPGV